MDRKKYRYDISGMSCAACVSHVERAAKKALDHIQPKEMDTCDYDVTVSLLTSSMNVEIDESLVEKVGKDALDRALMTEISHAGYHAKIADATVTERKQTAKQTEKTEKKRLKQSWLTFVLSALLTLILMLFSMGPMFGLVLVKDPLITALIQLALTIPVLILNRRYFIGGWRALCHFAPNMDSLIAIGSGASMIFGLFVVVRMVIAEQNGDTELLHSLAHNLYFESAAMIVTLVTLGKNMEKGARLRASRAIQALATMLPDTAIIVQDNKQETVPLSSVKIGDVVLCREGDLIPVDGIIISGRGAVNESALTGESIPADKTVGDKVHAACTLVEGSLLVRVEQVGEGTALSHILQLLEDAASSRAPVARLADKISLFFVPAVLLIAVFTFVFWMITTQNITQSLQFSISVLVISCPCALGLATPTAILVATGRGAERGVLFKSAEALEKLHATQVVCLDKTGTMTEGLPEVTDCIVCPTATSLSQTGSPLGRVEDLISLAAAVERHSSHPLSIAICRYADEKHIIPPTATDYVSIIGEGVKGLVNSKICLVGKKTLMWKQGVDEQNLLWFDKINEKLGGEGKTVVCVAYDGQAVGAIALADRVREDTPAAIARLSDMGVETLMLTGDNDTVASAVAQKAGVDGVRASLLPQDKEGVVRQLSSQCAVAMVGDGINDAPALARADVGIAIGAGTDVAIDCAGVVLTKSTLHGVADAIALSRRTMACIRENLFWALLYNTICIPVAAGALSSFGVTLNPMLAAGAMSLSSVCVVLNSLRLRKVSLSHHHFKRKKKNIIQNQTVINLQYNTSEDTADEVQKEDTVSMEANNQTVTLSVKGMMCQHCVAHVKKALEGVNGVNSVEVSLENENAVVMAEASVERKALVDAVVAAGYECE